MAKNFSIDEDYVEAEVYRETDINGSKVYLVKVSLIEISTYITGIRVQGSLRNPGESWWVQMPSIRVGAKYVKIIECGGSSIFREIIERKAEEAVKKYLAEGNLFAVKDVKLRETPEPIDLSDVPF